MPLRKHSPDAKPNPTREAHAELPTTFNFKHEHEVTTISTWQSNIYFVHFPSTRYCSRQHTQPKRRYSAWVRGKRQPRCFRRLHSPGTKQSTCWHNLKGGVKALHPHGCCRSHLCLSLLLECVPGTNTRTSKAGYKLCVCVECKVVVIYFAL